MTSRVGYVRWLICALLFFAATINYIDRNVISLLKGTLSKEFGWSETDYGDIVFAFSLAYAIGFVVAGRLMDKLGVRLGFAMAIVIWSLAAIGHAFAPTIGGPANAVLSMAGFGYTTSVAGFMFMRFLLGLGESGNFPAAIKTVAEWFPRRERALSTGVFNAGTNVGALATPLLVPWITLTYGWRWAFIGTGGLGFIWLVLWRFLYARPDAHPRISPAELAYIRSDPQVPAASVPWRALVKHRQAWAFAIGKFLTDPIWWLYLYWVPDFLNRNYGLNLTAIGPPLVAIYLVADVGSVGGGYISSRLLARGWTPNGARKTAMLVCALSVVPIVFAAGMHSLWGAVAIVSLAAAAHQGWSANLFTLTSDMFPQNAVGSVVGFGGMAGAIGGMCIAKVTGAILQATGSYVPVFLIAGSAYLVALGIIHALAPKLEPASLN
jgi:ACS family hexuronate transporter-like MFS transporter